MNKQLHQSVITVLVADDHDIVRSGICSLINTAKDIRVIGESSNGEETLLSYKKLLPDVVILDISMPVLNGIATTEMLTKNFPDSKVLILSMHIQEEYLKQVLRAGARGYLLKNCDKDELLNGIRTVYSGQTVFSSDISELMKRRYLDEMDVKEQVVDQHTSIETENEDVFSELTKRELEVLVAICSGLTNQEIAQKLFISPRTAETHRSNIMHKLSIKNTAALVRFAVEKGILNLG